MVVGLHNIEIKQPSEILLLGRRAIENLKEVEILEDFRWNPLLRKWMLFCQISIDTSSVYIGTKTNWYVLVDSDYPFGSIDFYPALQEGIVRTFPHQNYNGIYDDDRPWRKGKLCLDTSVKALGRYGNDEEPRNGENRLLWHFLRAILWLKLASKGELVKSDDYFELPHFPAATLDLIVFSESPVTLQRWNDSDINYGLVQFVELKKDPQILIVKRFKDIRNNDLYLPKWGTEISDAVAYPIVGLWIKLKEIPVMQPWQAPATWGELHEVLMHQGIDLMRHLMNNARFCRDGFPHVLMLGFPIPEYFSGVRTVMNWQAAKLPVLSHGNKFANGFRKGERGYWHRDKTTILRKKEKLQWINTENWHRNEILNRGKLSAKVSQTSILQIGAGSLGSMIAEQLVRADLQKLTVVDPDIVQVGNLTRHMLGMHQIGENKAIQLAHKLNSSIPHSKVKAVNEKFNDSSQFACSDYRVVIDCTGEDQVLHSLNQISWDSSKIFISASLGFAARRLFFYTEYSKSFSSSTYFKLVAPWIERERQSYTENDLPRDGIGCWNPVFPARVDDVWMMSSVAVKNIEKYIQNPSCRTVLLVYEQIWDGDSFCGIELISKEEGDE